MRSSTIVSLAFSALVALPLLGCIGALEDAPEGPRGTGPRDPGGNPDDPPEPVGPGGEPLPMPPSDPEALCEGVAPGPRVLRLLTRAEYRATAASLLYVTEPDIDRLPIETRVRGYDDIASQQAITPVHAEEHAALASALAEEAVATSLDRILPGCAAGAPGCDRAFVERFGRRAFRRPLSGDEVTRYMGLFDPALTTGDFRVGVQLVVEAMLQSPYFLYRHEVGEPVGDGTYALTSHEIASALSYTFWGTMPDEALDAIADRDGLRDTATIEAEARRLLADRRARPRIADFFTQWLGTTTLLSTNKDTAVFPQFTPEVRRAMADEERLFVESVIWGDSHRFTDLFDADYVFANDALARYYGLPSPGGTALSRVALSGDAASQRGGVLRLGSVLASHAHANETSPVRRGLMVRDRLLCQHFEAPPGLDITPPGLDPSLTTRDRFARHTADPSCQSCHQFIDGLGFSFERYDGAGMYRTTEHGLPVDDSGVLVGAARLTDGTSVDFHGPGELSAMLAESQAAESCMARQWWRWSRGVVEDELGPDECAVRQLAHDLRESDGDLVHLFVVALSQPSFLIRRADVVTEEM